MSYTRALSAARAVGSRNPADPMSVEPVTSSETQRLESLREPPRVGLLGLGERLEPLGNLLEAFAACGLREARVHLRELVGLPLDGGLEVLLGGADRHPRPRVAPRL